MRDKIGLFLLVAVMVFLLVVIAEYDIGPFTPKVALSVEPISDIIEVNEYATFSIRVENSDEKTLHPIVKIGPSNSKDSQHITISPDEIDKGEMKTGASWTEPIQITGYVFGEKVTYPITVTLYVDGRDITEQEIKLTVTS